MGLFRVTSIMLVIAGLLICIVGTIHTWVGFSFFDESTQTALGGWWSSYLVMFFNTGAGLLLSGGLLIHYGVVFRKLGSDVLLPLFLVTSFLMVAGTLAVISMADNIFSWIITGLSLVVFVALVLSCIAAKSLQRE